MTDWPDSIGDRPSTVLNTASPISAAGDQLVIGGGTLTTSAVWPTASTAIFLPCMLREQRTVYQLSHENGTVVSGNVDIGVYDERGTRLVSRGGVAQAGTSTIQLHDVTDTVIGPGVVFLAMVLDNITGTALRTSTPAVQMRACGVCTMASAYPLPATATLVGTAAAYTPAFGAHLVATV